jgi:hypothetical protein
MSITSHPIWERVRPYLTIDHYDRDGGHADPRIRIGFSGLPQPLGIEAAHVQMRCVEPSCQRPINPLRRREGDDWTRLYYAPCCPVTTRARCSRGAAAAAEYDRFKSPVIVSPTAQLSMF